MERISERLSKLILAVMLVLQIPSLGTEGQGYPQYVTATKQVEFSFVKPVKRDTAAIRNNRANVAMKAVRDDSANSHDTVAQTASKNFPLSSQVA